MIEQHLPNQSSLVNLIVDQITFTIQRYFRARFIRIFIGSKEKNVQSMPRSNYIRLTKLPTINVTTESVPTVSVSALRTIRSVPSTQPYVYPPLTLREGPIDLYLAAVRHLFLDPPTLSSAISSILSLSFRKEDFSINKLLQFVKSSWKRNYSIGTSHLQLVLQPKLLTNESLKYVLIFIYYT